ncbi:hypothetical protein DIPPA_32399 [Diplonema papillatum]|nr:hypothetical protein DIPPA_32399 [Diplonema papillatum]
MATQKERDAARLQALASPLVSRRLVHRRSLTDATPPGAKRTPPSGGGLTRSVGVTGGLARRTSPSPTKQLLPLYSIPLARSQPSTPVLPPSDPTRRRGAQTPANASLEEPASAWQPPSAGSTPGTTPDTVKKRPAAGAHDRAAQATVPTEVSASAKLLSPPYSSSKPAPMAATTTAGADRVAQAKILSAPTTTTTPGAYKSNLECVSPSEERPATTTTPAHSPAPNSAGGTPASPHAESPARLLRRMSSLSISACDSDPPKQTPPWGVSAEAGAAAASPFTQSPTSGGGERFSTRPTSGGAGPPAEARRLQDPYSARSAETGAAAASPFTQSPTSGGGGLSAETRRLQDFCTRSPTSGGAGQARRLQDPDREAITKEDAEPAKEPSEHVSARFEGGIPAKADETEGRRSARGELLRERPGDPRDDARSQGSVREEQRSGGPPAGTFPDEANDAASSSFASSPLEVNFALYTPSPLLSPRKSSPFSRRGGRHPARPDSDDPNRQTAAWQATRPLDSLGSAAAASADEYGGRANRGRDAVRGGEHPQLRTATGGEQRGLPQASGRAAGIRRERGPGTGALAGEEDEEESEDGSTANVVSEMTVSQANASLRQMMAMSAVTKEEAPPDETLRVSGLTSISETLKLSGEKGRSSAFSLSRESHPEGSAKASSAKDHLSLSQSQFLTTHDADARAQMMSPLNLADEDGDESILRQQTQLFSSASSSLSLRGSGRNASLARLRGKGGGGPAAAEGEEAAPGPSGARAQFLPASGGLAAAREGDDAHSQLSQPSIVQVSEPSPPRLRQSQRPAHLGPVPLHAFDTQAAALSPRYTVSAPGSAASSPRRSEGVDLFPQGSSTSFPELQATTAQPVLFSATARAQQQGAGDGFETCAVVDTPERLLSGIENLVFEPEAALNTGRASPEPRQGAETAGKRGESGGSRRDPPPPDADTRVSAGPTGAVVPDPQPAGRQQRCAQRRVAGEKTPERGQPKHPRESSAWQSTPRCNKYPSVPSSTSPSEPRHRPPSLSNSASKKTKKAASPSPPPPPPLSALPSTTSPPEPRPNSTPNKTKQTASPSPPPPPALPGLPSSTSPPPEPGRGQPTAAASPSPDPSSLSPSPRPVDSRGLPFGRAHSGPPGRGRPAAAQGSPLSSPRTQRIVLETAVLAVFQSEEFKRRAIEWTEGLARCRIADATPSAKCRSEARRNCALLAGQLADEETTWRLRLLSLETLRSSVSSRTSRSRASVSSSSTASQHRPGRRKKGKNDWRPLSPTSDPASSHPHLARWPSTSPPLSPGLQPVRLTPVNSPTATIHPAPLQHPHTGVPAPGKSFSAAHPQLSSPTDSPTTTIHTAQMQPGQSSFGASAARPDAFPSSTVRTLSSPAAAGVRRSPQAAPQSTRPAGPQGATAGPLAWPMSHAFGSSSSSAAPRGAVPAHARELFSEGPSAGTSLASLLPAPEERVGCDFSETLPADPSLASLVLAPEKRGWSNFSETPPGDDLLASLVPAPEKRGRSNFCETPLAAASSASLAASEERERSALRHAEYRARVFAQQAATVAVRAARARHQRSEEESQRRRIMASGLAAAGGEPTCPPESLQRRILDESSRTFEAFRGQRGPEVYWDPEAHVASDEESQRRLASGLAAADGERTCPPESLCQRVLDESSRSFEMYWDAEAHAISEDCRSGRAELAREEESQRRRILASGLAEAEGERRARTLLSERFAFADVAGSWVLETAAAAARHIVQGAVAELHRRASPPEAPGSSFRTPAPARTAAAPSCSSSGSSTVSSTRSSGGGASSRPRRTPPKPPAAGPQAGPEVLWRTLSPVDSVKVARRAHRSEIGSFTPARQKSRREPGSGVQAGPTRLGRTLSSFGSAKAARGDQQTSTARGEGGSSSPARQKSRREPASGAQTGLLGRTLSPVDSVAAARWGQQTSPTRSERSSPPSARQKSRRESASSTQPGPGLLGRTLSPVDSETAARSDQLTGATRSEAPERSGPPSARQKSRRDPAASTQMGPAPLGRTLSPLDSAKAARGAQRPSGARSAAGSGRKSRGEPSPDRRLRAPSPARTPSPLAGHGGVDDGWQRFRDRLLATPIRPPSHEPPCAPCNEHTPTAGGSGSIPRPRTLSPQRVEEEEEKKKKTVSMSPPAWRQPQRGGAGLLDAAKAEGAEPAGHAGQPPRRRPARRSDQKKAHFFVTSPPGTDGPRRASLHLPALPLPLPATPPRSPGGAAGPVALSFEASFTSEPAAPEGDASINSAVSCSAETHYIRLTGTGFLTLRSPSTGSDDDTAARSILSHAKDRPQEPHALPLQGHPPSDDSDAAISTANGSYEGAAPFSDDAHRIEFESSGAETAFLHEQTLPQDPRGAERAGFAGESDGEEAGDRSFFGEFFEAGDLFSYDDIVMATVRLDQLPEDATQSSDESGTQSTLPPDESEYLREGEGSFLQPAGDAKPLENTLPAPLGTASHPLTQADPRRWEVALDDEPRGNRRDRNEGVPVHDESRSHGAEMELPRTQGVAEKQEFRMTRKSRDTPASVPEVGLSWSVAGQVTCKTSLGPRWPPCATATERAPRSCADGAILGHPAATAPRQSQPPHVDPAQRLGSVSARSASLLADPSQPQSPGAPGASGSSKPGGYPYFQRTQTYEDEFRKRNREEQWKKVEGVNLVTAAFFKEGSARRVVNTTASLPEGAKRAALLQSVERDRRSVIVEQELKCFAKVEHRFEARKREIEKSLSGYGLGAPTVVCVDLAEPRQVARRVLKESSTNDYHSRFDTWRATKKVADSSPHRSENIPLQTFEGLSLPLPHAYASDTHSEQQQQQEENREDEEDEDAFSATQLPRKHYHAHPQPYTTAAVKPETVLPKKLFTDPTSTTRLNPPPSSSDDSSFHLSLPARHAAAVPSGPSSAPHLGETVSQPDRKPRKDSSGAAVDRRRLPSKRRAALGKRASVSNQTLSKNGTVSSRDGQALAGSETSSERKEFDLAGLAVYYAPSLPHSEVSFLEQEEAVRRANLSQREAAISQHLRITASTLALKAAACVVNDFVKQRTNKADVAPRKRATSRLKPKAATGPRLQAKSQPERPVFDIDNGSVESSSAASYWADAANKRKQKLRYRAGPKGEHRRD